MRFQIQKGGAQRGAAPPGFELVGEDVVIGSTSWLAGDGRRQERFQVITFRDGKIEDMQGCTSRRQAERFARRRAGRG